MSHPQLVLHAFDGGNGLDSAAMTAVIYHMLISLWVGPRADNLYKHLYREGGGEVGQHASSTYNKGSFILSKKLKVNKELSKNMPQYELII